MRNFRLYELSTAHLETYEIGHAPPYIAVSHAWSDHIFAGNMATSFGSTAVRTIIAQRFPSVRHCWIDNFCIKQDDEADKVEQIPLMGEIYGRAEVVAIVLTCHFGFAQSHVDRATETLQEALRAWKEEAWAEKTFVQQWTHGSGRKKLVQSMEGLAKLTKSSWATRIWTLQEYILATSVVWIGSDLNPVVIDDMLFQAIPGLCDQLRIQECMSRDPESQLGILHTHFSGMVNSRLTKIDRTRTMELLGNRKATVPVDEVYGIMAACGVEIEPIAGESRNQAWARWWEAAVRQGHVRWALLPPTPMDEARVLDTNSTNCIVPGFLHRHNVSSASYLDSVTPLDTLFIDNGTLVLSGHLTGRCELLRKLGNGHRSQQGFYHRDLTLILFARGRWFDALQIVEAFGPGRYNRKQQISLAQVLVDNHCRVLHHVRKRTELQFNPTVRSILHENLWKDFMQLQARCIMDGLNVGIGFLARIYHPTSSASLITVVITGHRLPTNPLIALDFNAVTGDQRKILLVAEVPVNTSGAEKHESLPSLHKYGTTIPVTLEQHCKWGTMPLERFSLGGSRCRICAKGPEASVDTAMKLDISVAKTKSSMWPQRQRTGLILYREQLDRRGRLNSIRQKLDLSGLNLSRKRFLRLRHWYNP